MHPAARRASCHLETDRLADSCRARLSLPFGCVDFALSRHDLVEASIGCPLANEIREISSCSVTDGCFGQFIEDYPVQTLPAPGSFAAEGLVYLLQDASDGDWTTVACSACSMIAESEGTLT